MALWTMACKEKTIPNSFRPHMNEWDSICIWGLGNWKRDPQSSWICFVFYHKSANPTWMRWGRGRTWGRMYLGSQRRMHLNIVGDVYRLCLEAGPGPCCKTNCWSHCQAFVNPQLPDGWNSGKAGSCPFVEKSSCWQGGSNLAKSETSSVLLSAARTPLRKNSPGCVSSGQQVSYESASPSSVCSDCFCSFSFLIFSVLECRLLELLTLLLCRLGWELKPQAFLFPAPVREVFGHLVAWIANTVGLWVQICFHGYQHRDARSRRFIW